MRWIRFVALGLLFAAAARGGEFLSPRAREVRTQAAVLMPPHVELVEHGVKGSQAQLQEAAEAGDKMVQALARLLREKGVRIEDSLLTSGPGQDAGLRAQMASVRKRYEAVAARMHPKPKDVRKGRFSLGDEIAEFPLAAKAEALVFLYASAFRVTKSRAAVLGGSGLFAGTQMTAWVSLVDSVTGDVLYLATGRFRVKSSDTVEDYHRDLSGMLKQVPLGGKPVT